MRLIVPLPDRPTGLITDSTALPFLDQHENFGELIPVGFGQLSHLPVHFLKQLRQDSVIYHTDSSMSSILARRRPNSASKVSSLTPPTRFANKEVRMGSTLIPAGGERGEVV